MAGVSTSLALQICAIERAGHAGSAAEAARISYELETGGLGTMWAENLRIEQSSLRRRVHHLVSTFIPRLGRPPLVLSRLDRTGLRCQIVILQLQPTTLSAGYPRQMPLAPIGGPPTPESCLHVLIYRENRVILVDPPLIGGLLRIVIA